MNDIGLNDIGLNDIGSLLLTSPNPNATLDTLTRADLYQWIYYRDDYDDFTYTTGKNKGQRIKPIASRAGKRLWLAAMGTFAPVSRLVWCWFVGRMPAGQVTFADGDSDNYVIENLRVDGKPYTKFIPRPKQTRYLHGKHVYFYKRTGKWRVSVANRHVGYYDTEEQATAVAEQYIRDNPEYRPPSRLDKVMEKRAEQMRAAEEQSPEYIAAQREAKLQDKESKAEAKRRKRAEIDDRNAKRIADDKAHRAKHAARLSGEHAHALAVVAAYAKSTAAREAHRAATGDTKITKEDRRFARSVKAANDRLAKFTEEGREALRYAYEVKKARAAVRKGTRVQAATRSAADTLKRDIARAASRYPNAPIKREQ